MPSKRAANKGVYASEVIAALEAWAPPEWAEGWDNVGLLLGDPARKVAKVLVALDATDEVVAEAVAGGFDFIITHHPLIYDPLRKIRTETVVGRKLLTLAAAGIGLYCTHTNLDKAPGGVNDCLFERLQLQDAAPLLGEAGEDAGLGLVGNLVAPMSLSAFSRYVKDLLGADGVRYAGAAEATIKKVGLCAGDASHMRYWKAALEKGCDVFITGDLRYHGAYDAIESGISLVDISHYAGEVLILEAIAARLGALVPTYATRVNGQIFSSII